MFDRVWTKVVTAIHGNRYSQDGFLLTRRHFIMPEQVRALGQSYLGVWGLLIFIACVKFIVANYGNGSRAHFSSVAEMPFAVKAILPVAIVGHLTGLVSMIRLFFTWRAIGDQRRESLGE